MFSLKADSTKIKYYYSHKYNNSDDIEYILFTVPFTNHKIYQKYKMIAQFRRREDFK